MENLYETKKKNYSNYIFKETDYALKKLNDNNSYGGHNDKKDALRHSLMNAEKACFNGAFNSRMMGNSHEWKANFNGTQPKEEYFMDLWNNQVGRDIGETIRKKYNIKKEEHLSQFERQKYRDLIISEIGEKMNSGKLITGVDDKRIEQLKKEFSNEKDWFPERKISDFIKKKYPNSSPTGYAASAVDDSVLSLKNRVFHNHELDFNKENNQEVINQAIGQYFDGGKKFPSKQDLDNKVSTGELVYVEDYTRSDGTKVSGYYRAHPHK